MISAIYFRDGFIPDDGGNIRDYVPKEMGCSTIIGHCGISDAFQCIDFVHNEIDNSQAVYTNNPLIVDRAKEVADVSWDNIYLFDWKKKTFVPAQETTNKDLRKEHIFSRLWLGGLFTDTNAAADMVEQQKLNNEAIDKLYSYIK